MAKETMRFFRQSLMNVLWSHCHPRTHARSAKQWSWLQAFHYAFPSSQRRMFCTTIRLRKEFSQASDLADKNLDLDVWKSVMRSPQPQGQEEEADDQMDDDDGNDDNVECSTLEATRKLVEMWRMAGRLVPEQISDEDLLGLADLTTKSSKKRYLKFLALKERYRKAEKEKKERKRAENASKAEKQQNTEEEEGGPDRPPRNTFLLQFWSRSSDTVYNWRAAQALRFGQPLVFDMSYEQNMSRPELVSAVSQLLESEGWNRRSIDPFHLHFCNLQQGGTYHRELLRRYGQSTWDRLLITATEQHYVDLFPRDQIVYLTADSPNVLRTFNHSKVYIVGSMVDKSIQTGLSLAKAKRLQLATARLPLDDFLHWDSGSKNLTLDQMMRILLKLKDGGTWEEALEFVPTRKHEGFYKQPKPEKQGAGIAKGRPDAFTGRSAGQSEQNRGEYRWPGQAKVITVLNTSRIRVSDVKPKRKKKLVGRGAD